jgi:hypothetical protein
MPEPTLPVRYNDTTVRWEYYHGAITGWTAYPQAEGATTLVPGLMSAADKAKIDAITSPFQPKGNIAVAADFPTAVLVQTGWTYHITTNVIDNDVTKTNTGLAFAAGDDIYWIGGTWELGGVNNAFVDQGGITIPANFPTPAQVRVGWVYRIAADVIDSDGTKTNTGLSFAVGEKIYWNGATWSILGNQNALVDKGTIANAAGFPTVAAVRTGWTYRATAAVIDNDGTKTNSGLSFSAGDLFYWSGATWLNAGNSTGIVYQGTIANAAGFPLPAVVRTGWLYRATADVTDNDVTKTNTGLSFFANERFFWTGSTWVKPHQDPVFRGMHSIAALILDAVPGAGETFTIGTNVYSFVAVVAAPTDILIVGGDAAATRANAVAVVNTVETTLTAVDDIANTQMVVYADAPGVVSAALAQTIGPATCIWSEDTNLNAASAAYRTRASTLTMTIDAVNAAAPFQVMFPFAPATIIMQARTAVGVIKYTTATIVPLVAVANAYTIDPTAGATALVATDILSIVAFA